MSEFPNGTSPIDTYMRFNLVVILKLWFQRQTSADLAKNMWVPSPFKGYQYVECGPAVVISK